MACEDSAGVNPRTVFGVAFVLLLLASAPFAASVSTQPDSETVDFDRTKTVGVPETVVRQAQRTGLVLPKAEVFYSQYRYVVGYYGITPLVASMQSDRDRALGRPLTIYVTDFSRTNVSLTDEGYPWIPETSPVSPDWVPATEAYFVVNSAARIPTQDSVVVPFSDRQDAKAFIAQYGGELRRWRGVQRLPVGGLGRSREAWQAEVRQRHRRATRLVRARRALLDRPVSVVVGRSAPTIEAAIARAPPNTTVFVPPGTYNVSDLRIRKPLTLRGAGPNATSIIGDRNGSVIYAPHARTAIAKVSITGVGRNRSGANRTLSEIGIDPNATLFNMRKVHGYGDAGIVFDTARDSLVSNVTINTTSNGIIARDSPGVAITNLTVYGTKRWQDGFLGVSAVGSPLVVQDSRFLGGKVGVYALDVSGVVVSDSVMEGMMLGSFNLYARELLIANNTIEDTSFGVYVETRSFETAVVGNSLRNSGNGLIVAGTANYVANNVVAKNDRGIVVEGHYTLYTRNVLAFNDVGFRAIGLLPTNRVTANDVVSNRWPAQVSTHNIFHVWRGNYWSSAPGVRRTPTGHLERGFYPTGPVDSVVDRVRYAPVLARSPALQFLRQLRRLVPGLQASGVVDPAPLARPVRPATIKRLVSTYETVGRKPDDDPWDFVP